MEKLPLPILGKIAEYSRSTYDVKVTITFNDDNLNTILQDVDILDGYNVPIRFTVDFIIDFPNNNVRNWFADMITDIDRRIPMPFNRGSIQNLENEIDVRFDHTIDTRWIQQNYNVPNTDRVAFKISLSVYTEVAPDNVEDEWDNIRGEIRDFMIDQSPLIMRYLFAPSNSLLEPTRYLAQTPFYSYKLFPDDTAFSRWTWSDKLVQMGNNALRVFTQNYRWTFQLVNNTPEKLTNKRDDETFVLKLKL